MPVPNAVALTHPREALFGATDLPPIALPVCDHYAGVEARMRKSLALQAEMGPVFDVTLDCEDGARVGGEIEHAHLLAELIASPLNAHNRVGVRVHPVRHGAFAKEIEVLVHRAGQRLAYLMLPKIQGLTELQAACAEVDHQARLHAGGRPIPLHALIETHGALREVDMIAAHPRIESLSFGLMDFVSAHYGAIPGSAMTAKGQFEHPLVVRAKLEIAAACHAHGKTPSHCVVTEYKDAQLLKTAASTAARSFGYTRMWSIHPSQISTILAAFAPSAAEVEQAAAILLAAQEAHWAPISFKSGSTDTLHDRASYRYFWHVLERAHRTGQALPAQASLAFFDNVGV